MVLNLGHRPARSVDNEAHENTRDNTSAREGDEPPEVNPGNHTPVDSPPITIAETNAHSSTGDALCGRNGELETSSHDNSDNTTHFNRKTSRW